MLLNAADPFEELALVGVEVDEKQALVGYECDEGYQ